MATRRQNARRQGPENPPEADVFGDGKLIDPSLMDKQGRGQAQIAKPTTRSAPLANKTTNKAAGATTRANQKTAPEPRHPIRARPRGQATANAPTISIPADENAGQVAKRVIKPLKSKNGTTVSASARSRLPETAEVGLAQSLIPAKKAADGPRFRADAEEVAQPELEEALEEEVGRSKRVRPNESLPADYGWQDLDLGDEEDPLMVTEYVTEIYQYLREVELKTLPDPHYMEQQEDVSWRMRGILVDWLIELHIKFRLLPETIFLAVNLVDRFCSKRVVSVVKYQLVGGVALFIAAKYEEIMCPSISNFLYMSDSGYTEEEFLEAERYLLQMIGWDLSYPNPINFLRRISKADDYDVQSRTVAKFLMEISCVERKMIGQTPSLIAASGAWLARKILGRGEWDANLIHYSGYTEAEIVPCAQLMLNYVVKVIHTGKELEHPNFVKKYSSRKFYKAAETVTEWVKLNFLSGEDSKRTVQNYARNAHFLSPKNNRGAGSSPHPERVQCFLNELQTNDETD